MRVQWSKGYFIYQLNGQTLTGHQHRSSEYGSEDSDCTVDISALDLDATRLDPVQGYFNFACKANSACVRYSSHQCTEFPNTPCPTNFTDQLTPQIGIRDESTRQECENFLRTVKAAAQNPARTANPSPSPAQEPVIDGSRIPNKIDFRNQPATPSATAVPLKRVFVPRGSLSGSGDSATASANSSLRQDTVTGPEKLEPLFDNKGNEPESSLELEPEELKKEVEKYSAGLFDQLREAKLETASDVGRYIAGEWLSDQFDKLTQNTTSYSLTGKSFDELPEEFRKDYEVWNAGLKRILEPFSLKSGLELVDAFGSLFDLWTER